jgi:hypothetical protein
MANCHDLFLSFHESIVLGDTAKERLRTARDAIREKIKDSFSEAKRTPVPKFWGQGSYVTHTIINPIDGEYDIDDGVYLQNLDKIDGSNWPTAETVHKWIIDAVTGHTGHSPIDKRTCVRLIYAGQYHVDLPIYAELNGENLHAEKGPQGWHRSDPKAIVTWFQDAAKKHGEKLRHMVRYFKAWADHNSKDGKLPSGFVFTVLIVGNFLAHDRDDVCFGKLVKAIHSQLMSSLCVLNPVDSSEDLLARYPEEQKKRLAASFSRLQKVAANALSAENKVDACKAWRAEFGSRWPDCGKLKKNDRPLYTTGPAILKDDARSA